MNKKDRKELSVIINQIQGLVDELREMSYAEQEKYDNLSEGLQASERGERYQDIADCIEDTCSTIEAALDDLDECFE